MAFSSFWTTSRDDNDEDNGNDGTGTATTSERTGLLPLFSHFPLGTSTLSSTSASTRASASASTSASASIEPSELSSRIPIFTFPNGSYGSIANADGTVTPIRTVRNGDDDDNNDDDDDDDNDNDSNVDDLAYSDSGDADSHFVDAEEGGREQHQQPPSSEIPTSTATAAIGVAVGVEPPPLRDGAIGNLTRRLRCLFSLITFPIVPLGTIVTLALLWVLYAATSLDLRRSCAHPLHSYSLVSFLLVVYIPNHSRVRSQMFRYSRERDGPIRPVRVRMYDQFFHTICLLYVYSGVMLVQTCKDDLINSPADSVTVAVAAFSLAQYGDTDIEAIPRNACEATCPNLYEAVRVYVATLELFTFALVLPLLFLPCIYLWFLQRATAEANEFARIQAVLQEETAILSNGGVTTGEILNSLETITIVKRRASVESSGSSSSTNNNNNNSNSNNKLNDNLWILPNTAAPDDRNYTKCGTKECCICMTEFDVTVETEKEDEHDSTSSSSNSEDILNPPRCQVCNNNNDNGNGTNDNEENANSSTIVRTRCGHIFHKECLKGWVGGMWTASTSNNSNSNSNSTNTNANGDDGDWTKRKARQIHCPLCREDLRPQNFVLLN